MINDGWICVHRSLLEHPLWMNGTPFSEGQAWVDLMLMANHEDKEIKVNSDPLIVHRGQRFTSVRKLAERWGWSRDKVTRYLGYLVRSGMILKDATHNGTLLTLVKYDFFQNRETPKKTRSGRARDVLGTRSGRGQGTNNNDNNDNNENNENKIKPAPPVGGGEWE